MLKIWAAAALATGFLATPGHAHPGNHARMGLLETIQHYAEPDHLAFLGLTVVVAWVAFRIGRRAEARGPRAPDKRKQDRS
jgi:hypothetical protein